MHEENTSTNLVDIELQSSNNRKSLDNSDDEDSSMVNNVVKRRREELAQSPRSPTGAGATAGNSLDSKFLPSSGSTSNALTSFVKSNKRSIVIGSIVAIVAAALIFILLIVILQLRNSGGNGGDVKPVPVPPSPIVPASSKKYSVQNHTATILSFGKRSLTTPGHTQTREYISSVLKEFSWNVTTHEALYNGVPVFGTVTFRNIIGSYKLPRVANPSAATKSLVIACHYDSKYFADGVFLGATDSAVPCAMMLDLAEIISKTAATNFSIPQSTTNSSSVGQLNIGEILLVFFDGEEAVQYWTDSDSLYGARALAQTWHNENKLSSIALFVLLDLIGEANPVFRNYGIHFNMRTNGYYDMLADIEIEVNNFYRTHTNYFPKGYNSNNVLDDHVPFMQRGVPILHLIPNPFPNSWHTLSDNMNALHFPTINTLQTILQQFASRYVKL